MPVNKCKKGRLAQEWVLLMFCFAAFVIGGLKRGALQSDKFPYGDAELKNIADKFKIQ